MRRRVVLPIALVAVPVIAWTPSLVASRYSDRSASDLLSRPVDGWRFLKDAVVESRAARLGWEDAALARAREIWVSRPGAGAVALRWGTTRVAVAPGVWVPVRSPFNWIVSGRVRSGEARRVIGILDYSSGQTVWSIVPLRRAA